MLRTGSKLAGRADPDPRLPQGDGRDPARQQGCSAKQARAFAAAGAFVGHLYPVWLKFRGGKGVATLLGILIAAAADRGGCLCRVWILLLLTIRISSVAGMAAAISAPITAAVLHSSLFPMLLGFAVLVLWKHRENILRLIERNRATHWESKA